MVRIRVIIITSQGCSENKMRSYTENTWQSAWHNRSTQQTVNAFKVPTDFKVLLSTNTLWRPSPEARGPRAPPLGFQKQRTLVSGVQSCSSPRGEGSPSSWQSRGPVCAGESPGSAVSKLCAVGPVSSTIRWQSLSLCPSQGFTRHTHTTRCTKQELMQGGFVGDKRKRCIYQ